MKWQDDCEPRKLIIEYRAYDDYTPGWRTHVLCADYPIRAEGRYQGQIAKHYYVRHVPAGAENVHILLFTRRKLDDVKYEKLSREGLELYSRVKQNFDALSTGSADGESVKE